MKIRHYSSLGYKDIERILQKLKWKHFNKGKKSKTNWRNSLDSKIYSLADRLSYYLYLMRCEK